MFVESYKGGRVDSWVFACCFGSLCLLRMAAMTAGHRTAGQRQNVLAGALATVSVFIWPTALMLVPLLLAELWTVSGVRGRGTKRIPPVFQFGVGGLLAVIILLLPTLGDLQQILRSTQEIIHGERWAKLVQVSAFHTFMTRDPMLLIVALFALWFRREVAVLVAFVAAVLLMYQTMVYANRLIYLLPYMMTIICAAGVVVVKPSVNATSKLLFTAVLVLLMLWSTSVSLIITPVNSFQERVARNPRILHTALAESIGRGDFRVYLNEWELYYAARDLDWQVFRITVPGDATKTMSLYDSMDYLIYRPGTLNPSRAEWLRALGFQYSTVILPVAGVDNNKEARFSTFGWPLRQQIYGPYIIFSKTPM